LLFRQRAVASYGAGSFDFCDPARSLVLRQLGPNAEIWFLARALRFLRLNEPNTGATDPT
jgi:hypothetical protein